MYLDEMTKDEFADWLSDEGVVILPLGAVEEHGPHLPLSTDSLQPIHIAERVAERIDGLVAPPIKYGLCVGTKDFPGTISITFDTLRAIVYEVVSELARHGVKNVVILSGHAGRSHMAALREAGQRLVAGKDIKLMVLSDYDIAYELDELMPDRDGHAGTIETSRVMAISPELVKGEMPEAFYPKYPGHQIVDDLSPYWGVGYNGDPQEASAELGEDVNDAIVERLVQAIREMVGG